MDSMFTNPTDFKCPACSGNLPKFVLYVSQPGHTIFDCKCENGHESSYCIFHGSISSIGVFFYREKEEITYKEYLQTPEWKTKANAVKDKAGWKCQLCNKTGNNKTLHAHHRTYENIGNEQDGDLIVLCNNCHAKFHDKEPS